MSGQKDWVLEGGHVCSSSSLSCGSRRWCEISVHSPPECEKYGGESDNKENSADSILLAQGMSSKYGQHRERAVKEASLQATILSHVMGVVGPKNALGQGLLNSPYIATENLILYRLELLDSETTCIKKCRFLCEILSSECHGNAGTHWLTDGGSAEGLCLASAGYFWAPSSLWLTPEPFFSGLLNALWLYDQLSGGKQPRAVIFFLLTSLIHTMLCHSAIPFRLGTVP